MNNVAKALYIIGILAIAGGLIIGFSLYETPIPGYTYITDKDWTVFWTYTLLGVISGVMMFGFAEIVNQLDKQTKLQESMNEYLHQVSSDIKRHIYKDDVQG